MDTRSSQKKSPRSSAKSKQESSTVKEQYTESDEEKYLDFSAGMVARVRAAKQAAQHEMESFGDASEYDLIILQGQLKKEVIAPTQPRLDFDGRPPETN